ncbi:MAG: hypothetical protein OXG72_07460 [Acidobacteria bacterium]|nr:hypothetical protein [Acidobacteriota bacterium]
MSDNRMIIATVVGTGIAMTTVIVAFVGIIAGGINSRIDDVNTTINNRIGDMNRRFDDLNASVNSRFDAVNQRIDDLNASVNNRFDAVNRRIDDLQNEMRELRALVIDSIKGADAAANE